MLEKPITPHLWFDTQAREAAELYVSLCPDSRIDHVTVIRDTPSGDCDMVSFTLRGQPFVAISAGPLFRFNPSISFFLHFDPEREPQAREQLDIAWAKLVDGGQVLMELGEYPFSKRYGWVQDRFGLSWQVTPLVLGQVMASGDQAAIDRVTQAFLPMHKLDVATIEAAAKGGTR